MDNSAYAASKTMWITPSGPLGITRSAFSSKGSDLISSSGRPSRFTRLHVKGERFDSSLVRASTASRRETRKLAAESGRTSNSGRDHRRGSPPNVNRTGVPT